LVEYKWIALSNTTIGVLMASINGTIVLISLPAIFRGISTNPLDSFQYLLWILMGYNLVTAAFLVTFGRLSDIFGRVRLYNIGFAVFTLGSILLSVTWSKGSSGALELIFFRMFQAVGGAFLFSNSAAIITDAFPVNERGKAMGINQIAALAGSLIGLVLGGILAASNWRYVFLVSVPFGVFGTAWSFAKLRETGVIDRGQKIDYIGNTFFAGGLLLLLLGVTYGLLPYGSSQMGWSDPWVVASLVTGTALLVTFPFVETRISQPMFRLELFRSRAFSAGVLTQVLFGMGFGGVMLMLIILLQGIWLPIHGYSYSSTPFWAGVYMLPMTLGFILMGPLAGYLSDRHGARLLATLGLVVAAVSFLALSSLSYNFSYPAFAAVLFIMGVGNGLFAAPNTAAVMNSVPSSTRGAASGMRATFQNTAQTASLAIFFTVIITSLTGSLPVDLSRALVSAGAPQLSTFASDIPVTGALFSAFLGYNPVAAILAGLPPSALSAIPKSVLLTLEGKYWFPETIAPAFMNALRLSFYIGSALSALGALISALRGKKLVVTEELNRFAKEPATVPPAQVTGDRK
jgi:EmrB/QacA subfamily drug resistance transporter